MLTGHWASVLVTLGSERVRVRTGNGAPHSARAQRRGVMTRSTTVQDPVRCRPHPPRPPCPLWKLQAQEQGKNPLAMGRWKFPAGVAGRDNTRDRHSPASPGITQNDVRSPSFLSHGGTSWGTPETLGCHAQGNEA